MSAKSMTATLQYAIVSEKKMLLIAKMVQWKKIHDAVVLLRHLPKKSAEILLKVVLSAVANAKHNLQLEATDLKIQTIDIWRGPKIKRVRPAWRSRMHGYIKHRAFVRVVLWFVS
jgi:large subunit ribosomal protein L22